MVIELDRPWKAFERSTAKQFGSSRMLMKGTDEKADIKHPLFHIDCKLRKAWSIPRWFRELRTDARKQHKIPLLVLRRPTKKITYAVCEFDTFISLAKGACWISEDAEEAAEIAVDGSG